MGKTSFLDCVHRDVQSYTMRCLECGYHIHMSKDEYRKDLQRQIDLQDADIRALERRLGIGK